MAQFVVQGPDGGKHVIEGPDNATPDQIEAFANQTLGPTDPKAAQPAITDQGDGRSFELRRDAAVPQPNPVAAAADARVQKEAAAGLAPQPSVVNAIPFKNDIMAGGEALLNKATGGRFGSPYDEAYAYQQARDRYVSEHDPKAQLASDIVGGIGLAPSLPVVNALKGAGIGSTVVNALLNGAGYGALYGAGDSSGEGRMANALAGAKSGAMTGAVLSPVLHGAGNALMTRAASNPPLPPELQSFDPRAVGTASQLFKEDNLGLPITGANAQSRTLGDNAMLMDMGPNMRAVGTALAKRTGPEMNTIVKAISGRQQGAEGRIDAAIDNAVGPPVNVPQMVQQMQAQKAAAAKPLYDAFRATPIKATDALGTILDRAKAAGAYDSAARLAAQDGIDVNQASNNGLFIDLIKRGLDSKIETAQRAGDATQVRSLSGIASDLRNETDSILRAQGNVARDAAGNVIKDSSGQPLSLYQQARQVAGEHLRLKDAFEEGQKAFSKTLSADQMAYDMRNMSQEERTMYRVGARQQIRAVAENSGTKSGGNPDTATRSMLQTRNAQKKLSLIAQRPSDARTLTRTLAAETKFDNTSMKALQNSDTALYMAAQKRVPGEIEANTQVHNLTMEGLVAAGAKKIVDSLTSNAISARNVRHAADLAKLITATGASRDKIVAGIEKVIQGANLSPAQKAALRTGAARALSLGAISASQNRTSGANVAVGR